MTIESRFFRTYNSPVLKSEFPDHDDFHTVPEYLKRKSKRNIKN